MSGKRTDALGRPTVELKASVRLDELLDALEEALVWSKTGQLSERDYQRLTAMCSGLRRKLDGEYN